MQSTMSFRYVRLRKRWSPARHEPQVKVVRQNQRRHKQRWWDRQAEWWSPPVVEVGRVMIISHVTIPTVQPTTACSGRR